MLTLTVVSALDPDTVKIKDPPMRSPSTARTIQLMAQPPAPVLPRENDTERISPRGDASTCSGAVHGPTPVLGERCGGFSIKRLPVADFQAANRLDRTVARGHFHHRHVKMTPSNPWCCRGIQSADTRRSAQRADSTMRP